MNNSTTNAPIEKETKGGDSPRCYLSSLSPVKKKLIGFTSLVVELRQDPKPSLADCGMPLLQYLTRCLVMAAGMAYPYILLCLEASALLRQYTQSSLSTVALSCVESRHSCVLRLFTFFTFFSLFSLRQDNTHTRLPCSIKLHHNLDRL